MENNNPESVADNELENLTMDVPEAEADAVAAEKSEVEKTDETEAVEAEDKAEETNMIAEETAESSDTGKTVEEDDKPAFTEIVFGTANLPEEEIVRDEITVSDEPYEEIAEEIAPEISEQQETEDVLPRVSVDHRFEDDDDDDDDEEMFEIEQRRRRRKRTGITLAVIFFVLAILIGSALSMNFVFTADKTVDDFFTAMEMGDVEKLAEVAEIEGVEAEFTAENAAPMFELYSDNAEFREMIDADLKEDLAAIKRGERPDDDGIVNVKAVNYVFFKMYYVTVARSEAVVYTNFNGAKVSLNGMTQIAYASKGYEYNAYGNVVSDDYFDHVESRAVFDNVLPGNYSVHVEYLSSFGETFSAEGSLEFMGDDVEYGINVEYQELEIINGTDYTVTVIMSDKAVQSIDAGLTYKMFPVTAGSEVVIHCETEDGISTDQTVTVGETASVELLFASLTVNNTANEAAIDYYINGKRQEPIPGGTGEFKIYPLNIGDKVEFLPAETKYQALVMPLIVDITEVNQQFDIVFSLKTDIYDGVDKIVTEDIVRSFEIINELHTKEELSETVLHYRTLAELIDYTYNEQTEMYTTLSAPEITINLGETVDAHFTHDSINMYVEATIKYTAGYHKKDETPKEEELVEKETVLSYTLEYADGKWFFPEVTGEH